MMETDINRAKDVLNDFPTEDDYLKMGGTLEYYRSCKRLVERDYINSYYRNKEGYIKIMRILFIVSLIGFSLLLLFILIATK